MEKTSIQNDEVSIAESAVTPLYTVYVSSHPGKVRSENEDNFIVNTVTRPVSKQETSMRGFDISEPLVCGVFDGMGGEAHGELASKISADSAASAYRAIAKKESNAAESVCAFVKESNDKIVNMLCNSKARRGGSTFVMSVFLEGRAQVFSLGDSRAYLFQNGTLQQITNDHTLAMKKYRANIYTWEEAISGPDSHKLTSFLGMDTDGMGLTPEAYPPIFMNKGDSLLLCSDGLYDMCSEQEIISLLGKSAEVVTLNLVKRALENGGVDNVTCIVIERTR